MARHEALWTATTRDGPSYPSLDRSVDVDVAVVGAGIAGLTTAQLGRPQVDSPKQIMLAQTPPAVGRGER